MTVRERILNACEPSRRCEVAMLLDRLIRDETSVIRAELDEWVDIAMRGEVVRRDLMLRAVVGGAFNTVQDRSANAPCDPWSRRRSGPRSGEDPK